MVGCAHATTLMKLALVDSVDHTLKRLPSLLAAVVVDDTQFQAVGKCHQVSQQLQRTIHLFTEHAEEVPGLEVGNACGAERTVAKVMAMGVKRFRVKMTFLELLRQAGAKVARLVKTAAVPSLICGSDATGTPPAQLNGARLMARKNCREKTYRFDLILEDAGTDPGSLRFYHGNCAWVERWVPALWMTKTLLAASERLRDCINPWKLVNGPASPFVASMVCFGWHVLSGREFGAHRVLSFASVGHGELRAVIQDAYDRWTWERVCNRLPVLALHGGPPLAAPLKLAMEHLRTSGEHLARGPLQSFGHDAHAKL